MRSLRRERLPAVAREGLQILLIRELRVRDRELPLEVGPAELLESAVGLGVDAGDEEARNRRDWGRIAAAGDEPFETAEIRLDDLGMALEGKDERDVDRAALGDAVLDRTETGLGSRDLHEQVRPVDELVEAHRLLVRPLSIVREARIHFERDVAVDSPGVLPRSAQKIAAATHVLDREVDEDLLRSLVASEDLAQLLVVPVARGERFLEDGRIGRDADDGVLLHEARQLARLEHLSRERVDPDADTVRGELVQATLCHVPRLPRSAREKPPNLECGA